jgi:aminocarboxymuconate-semialdehyde decarboxylase
MLFTCQPQAHRADEHVSAADRKRRPHGRRSRELTIDVHCHAHIAGVDEFLRRAFDPLNEPMLRFATDETRDVNRRMMRSVSAKLTSVQERLIDMDQLGIDVQAISCSPFQFNYWAEPEAALHASRLVNDGIARMVASEPARFVGLGTIPLQAPSLAVQELDRIVRELGFRGVQISTSVQGEELSAVRLRPFFARAEELDVLVFLHPNGYSDGLRLSRHYFINLIGNPLDSTLAISHLIFDGVLKDYPGLKVCVAHGGGFLPFYAGRMDHAYACRDDCRGSIDEPPSHYLRQLYFDTVVFTPEQIEFLVQQYGSDHVVLGTDYPYDMGESDPVSLIGRTRRLKRSDKAAILGGNAAKLLKLQADRRGTRPGP